MTDIADIMARAIREEIVRQYRDDDRGKCPVGRAYFEDEIGPYYIAEKALTALQERGFAVVPAVLDPAMRNAVNASMAARLCEFETMEPFEAEDYTAMLAASPGSSGVEAVEETGDRWYFDLENSWCAMLAAVEEKT